MRAFSLSRSHSLSCSLFWSTLSSIPIVYAHNIVDPCQSVKHAYLQQNDLVNEQQVGRRLTFRVFDIPFGVITNTVSVKQRCRMGILCSAIIIYCPLLHMYRDLQEIAKPSHIISDKHCGMRMKSTSRDLLKSLSKDKTKSEFKCVRNKCQSLQ